MAICVECIYVNNNLLECNNADLPITDFVDGTRDCYELNPKGACKGFKAKAKAESIYESKEDEELANISPEVTEALRAKGIEP